jgi:hypothetical protein
MRAWFGDVAGGVVNFRRDPLFRVWPRVPGGAAVHWPAVRYYGSITMSIGRRAWIGRRGEPVWRPLLTLTATWRGWGGAYHFPKLSVKRG